MDHSFFHPSSLRILLSLNPLTLSFFLWLLIQLFVISLFFGFYPPLSPPFSFPSPYYYSTFFFLSLAYIFLTCLLLKIFFFPSFYLSINVIKISYHYIFLPLTPFLPRTTFPHYSTHIYFFPTVCLSAVSFLWGCAVQNFYHF
jgi:hypothetical protein